MKRWEQTAGNTGYWDTQIKGGKNEGRKKERRKYLLYQEHLGKEEKVERVKMERIRTFKEGPDGMGGKGE